MIPEEVKNGFSQIPVLGDVLTALLAQIPAEFPANPITTQEVPAFPTSPEAIQAAIEDGIAQLTGAAGGGGLPTSPESVQAAIEDGIAQLTGAAGDSGLPTSPEAVQAAIEDGIAQLAGAAGDGGLPTSPEAVQAAIEDGIAQLTEALSGLGGGLGGGAPELPSSPISFEDGTLSITLADPTGTIPLSASASVSGLTAPEGLPIPFPM